MSVAANRPRRCNTISSRWKALTRGEHRSIKVNSQQHGIYNTSQQVLRLGYKKTPSFKFKKASYIRNPCRLIRAHLHEDTLGQDNILDKILSDYDTIRLFYSNAYNGLRQNTSTCLMFEIYQLRTCSQNQNLYCHWDLNWETKSFVGYLLNTTLFLSICGRTQLLIVIHYQFRN